MSQISDIVKQLETGTLSRDLDETGAEGFWDLAGNYARTAITGDTVQDTLNKETLQEALYNAFYAIYEATL